MTAHQYERHYSEQGFWNKVRTHAHQAGRHVMEKALWLYYTAKSPTTPLWARRAIYGALGYFILPIDAVPDIIPVAGFADDLSVFALALAGVAMYITPQIKRQAAEKVDRWFGPAPQADTSAA